jgi:hypothetical protein
MDRENCPDYVTSILDFGIAGAIRAFDAIHAEARKHAPDHLLYRGVLAGELVDAIDDLAPVIDGQRIISRDFDRSGINFADRNTFDPSKVLAKLQDGAFFKVMGETLFGDILAADIFLAVKILEINAEYMLDVDVTPEPEERAAGIGM